ncbi:hypothetical protein SAMN05192560_1162 [Methylobacillus rhizosphaerae]|uniref:Uncharacterized protein n=1 Tax=Methylobacillus rhizosphaerae TaxID=551994 RepID=A0A238ZAU2_9PROT|nr:hypothetical protein SAMN05192560_1162 [Methylobacillus rhizosphaerae]
MGKIYVKSMMESSTFGTDIKQLAEYSLSYMGASESVRPPSILHFLHSAKGLS